MTELKIEYIMVKVLLDTEFNFIQLETLDDILQTLHRSLQPERGLSKLAVIFKRLTLQWVRNQMSWSV